MGFRWKALLPRTVKMSGWFLSAIMNGGFLLNVALPGPVGEFVTADLVRRHYKIPISEALAANVHARFVGLVLAALLALGCWILFPIKVPEGYGSIVFAVALVMVGIVLALSSLSLIPRWSRRVFDPLFRLATKITPSAFDGLTRRLQASVNNFTDALVNMDNRSPTAHIRATGWTLGGHGMSILGLTLTCEAFGQTPYLPGVIFAYCALTAGYVVVFALPIGQVGWDAALCTLLVVAAGVDFSVALAVTVVVRLQQTALCAMGGVALIFILRRQPTATANEA